MNKYTFNEDTFKFLISDANCDEARLYTTDRGLNRSFDNLVLDNIEFKRDEVYLKTIVLNECNFQQVEFEGADFKEFIWFKNCVFENDFIIYEGTFRNLLFDSCEFKKGLVIYNATMEIFSLENCTVINPIKIKGGIIQTFNYISANEKTHLIIDGYFTYINFLHLSTNIGTTVSISDSIINLLKIEGDFNSGSRINLKEIRNKDLLLTNVNNDGKFYATNFKIQYSTLEMTNDVEWFVENIEVKDVKVELRLILRNKPYIKTFTQLYNDLSLNVDTKNFLYYAFSTTVIQNQTDKINKPQLGVQYSSLGLFEFKSMRVNKYEITIISSDLSLAKLINTTFPTEINALTYSDGFSVYIDLYSSSNKQNNISDKVEYYQAAQRYLYKKIKTQPWSVQKLGSLSAIIISDFYSNHGSNWIRAASRTVFLIGLPTFIFFTGSLNEIALNISPQGIDYYLKSILPYFPEFLNPLHRIDFMSSISCNGGWSSLFDLIGRIFIGIGIFEMVRSFRKYVRN